MGSVVNTITGNDSFRNKIINGNFDIWQRGTTQTTANGYGSDDRWGNYYSGSSQSVSRQAFALGQTAVPGNPTYFSRTVVTSVAGAGNFVIKQQAIESVRTFAGKTVTVSFWAKADASKSMTAEFRQFFGDGGSPSATVEGIGSTKLSLTTSWQKFTMTAAIPSISGKTLGTANNDFFMLTFWFDAGSNFNSRSSNLGQQSGTFDIAQVQVEEGSTATTFEQRPIGVELSLCRRYLKPVFGVGFAVSAAPSLFDIGVDVSDMRNGTFSAYCAAVITVSATNWASTFTQSTVAAQVIITQPNYVRYRLSAFSGLTGAAAYIIESPNVAFVSAEL